MDDPPDRSLGPDPPCGKPEVHITPLEDEARCRAVVEQQVELLCRWLPDGTLTFVNEAYCRHFGKTREELLGLSFLSFLPKEERESANRQLAELFASLSPENPSMTFEHRIDLPSGGVRWQIWTDRGIFDEEGRLVELQSVGRDITERKTMEEALRTRVRQQAAVAEFGLKTLSGQGLPALMEEAVAVIVRLMGFETGGVLEHDTATKKLVLRAQVGLGEEAVGQLVLDAAPDNPAGHTFLTGEPAIVENLGAHGAFSGFSHHGFIRKSGVLSGINVVIAGSAGRPLGVFGGHNRHPRVFSADDVHFLQSVANILGTAMERASTENALRESEARFRELADLLPETVFETDSEGRITFVNRQGQTAFGITPDDLAKGLGALDMIVPEDRDRCRETMMMRLSERGPTGNEYTALKKNGGTVSIAVYSAPIVRSGRVAGLRGIIIDITERKRAERALRESEERFRQVVDNAPEIVFVTDLQGTALSLNPAFEKILGWRREEWLGKTLPGILHPDDVPVAYEYLRRIAVGEPLPLHIFRGRTRDGEYRSFELQSIPLVEKGRVSGLIGFTHDVTRAKELERVALVQEKMATLGQVAAGIAHEIRNPLSGINLYLDSLIKLLEESEGLEPDRRGMIHHMAEQVKAASVKIDEVIRRVMDFARPTPLRLSLVQINRAIGEAVELAQVMLRRSGISLASRLAGDLPPCLADETLIGQVLLNLITNAAQALEDRAGEKRIEIESSAVGDRVAITVGDSGPGVPPQIRNRIFEPFYTTKSKGTGIGLFFCQRIMADHGGALTLGDSRLGGAEFRIEIPCGEPSPKNRPGGLPANDS